MRRRIFLLVFFGLIATIVLLGCKKEPEKKSSGHLYMDIHKNLSGLTVEAAADAHKKDLEVQGKYGVNYLKYWYDEGTGTVFCLVEAPSKEAAAAVHKEANDIVADEVIEVKEGH
jgi:hypothetical protein